MHPERCLAIVIAVKDQLHVNTFLYRLYKSECWSLEHVSLPENRSIYAKRASVESRCFSELIQALFA